ncbi:MULTISPECIES: hypothetical protein [unclassified Streptomyces]|uniref:hypothetical protein n=1 Tax=unclassified Streptomyces TaxID=2593676 RepID=UPI002254FF36|nr:MULTISPECIES: hypothetical protein [unclassified Streptomyces]MCX5141943.1 hypothetical protein [Streptomyces sp. NBC_00338]WRZ66417.1 hypothetical protein OG408_22195 [Streptomyces sp. NBC_01257]WSU60411.1 hypothetical protein OG450_22360 [Streptomyces sp. NBC_01104]
MDNVISTGVRNLDEITAPPAGSGPRNLVIEHLDLFSEQHVALLSWCIRTESIEPLAA